MNATPVVAGPLDQIRILDFTDVMAGPYCTRLLSDLGAEVIKIESPTGDHNRPRPPLRDGRSSIFGHLNCGKKSVVLDLKSPAGREAAVALGLKSDVIVENWRPGVADRLGVAYKTFEIAKPNIIYCSISGYGQTGPKSLLPAYAPILHAASGFDLAQMEVDRTKHPGRTGIFIADIFSGFSAFSAIQAALYQRERTGRGQFIDVAMMDCMLNLLVFELQIAQHSASARRIMRPLRASDGFVCVAPYSDHTFADMMRAIGHPEWIDDLRFKELSKRDANWEVMLDCVETWTQVRSAEECESVFLAAKVPATRYRTVAEALIDEHLLARGSLRKVRDKSGEYLVTNTPFRMPGAEVEPRLRVPDQGEDTDVVLRTILDYSDVQIKACKS